MPRSLLAFLLAFLLALLLAPPLAAAWTIADMVREENGHLVIAARPMDAKFKNAWPKEWEEEFQRRGDSILKAQTAKSPPGSNTYFENEKRTYGILMAHLLAGQRETALKHLQGEDAQAKEWHRETAGIDYYAAFTLKHQMRKYFYFGDLLDPAYKKRMLEGGRRWTEQDPLRRPHYAFKARGPGWGPDVMNSWVDVRSTENLFLMRVTSVYLMAEETGNEEVRKQYKEILLNYAKALYRVGMGEWDSENYHGHSVAPLLNVYDFAKDSEVKLAAKAALDFIMATGAVKYYRGGFNGPTKRDYNHTQPFGGSAANMLWVYFGDSPRKNEHFESDEVHILTSAYRPPAAVVELARKNFARPCEILASKAHYEATTANQLDQGPQYLETHYFGRTFQLGSLVSGTSTGASDVNGFKLLAYDSERGVCDLQCVPGPDPLYAGSPKYTAGKIAGENRVAQNGPLAIWLVKNGTSPWVWLLPKKVQVSAAGGVAFLECERTWVALHLLNLTLPKADGPLTKAVSEVGGQDGKEKAAHPEHQVLFAKGQGGNYCGFAVEVGESPEFKSFAEFRAAVSSKSRVDGAKVGEGSASFTGANGKSVALYFGDTPAAARIDRDGVPHDLTAHGKLLFGPAGKSATPISALWSAGELKVEAGGKRFTCQVDDSGKVIFANAGE